VSGFRKGLPDGGSMLSRGVVLFAGLVLSAQPGNADRPGKPDELHLAELLSAVFRRGVALPKSIPDGQVLHGPVVVVREEMARSGGAKIPQGALTGLRDWVLRPAEAIQREADVTGRLQYFVIVEGVTVDGDKAIVEWGTDLAIPTPNDGGVVIKVCCSIATDEYHKHDGTWVFKKRSEQIVF
jgi:hypothetical protein